MKKRCPALVTRHDGEVASELDSIDRLDDLDTAEEWAKLDAR